MSMRIVFMGSSDASAMCLRGILRQPMLNVVGVVTQPDRPAGRGRELKPCPCRAYATERNINNCITPEDVNSPEAMETIRAWRPDLIAVVAFGQFLKKPLLELPKYGCVNCHFSLLPKYRGASPVTEALLNGDQITGVSVIKMGVGMDNGPIYYKNMEPIYQDDTGETLMERLAIAGGVALGRTLKLIATGHMGEPAPQVETEATFAWKHKKTDGLIDWNSPSATIERRLRAFNPWPGVYTFIPNRMRKRDSGRLIVGAVETVNLDNPAWRAQLPGTVLDASGRGIVVRTQDRALRLLAVKPEGGRMITGREFARSRDFKPLLDMMENS